jgi:hypothetical protein
VFATSVNFPARIPELQQGVIGNPEEQLVGDCKHFIINGKNVYFPTTGIQPTTEQAIKLSRADILRGTPENNAVAEWYMRMFGWIPADDTPSNTSESEGRLQIGFKGENEPTAIITLESGDDKNPEHQEEKKHIAFWRAFRQIAADPVGRVLLYRILIEIRRQGGGSGTVEQQVIDSWEKKRLPIKDKSDFLLEHNSSRSIIINHYRLKPVVWKTLKKRLNA